MYSAHPQEEDRKELGRDDMKDAESELKRRYQIKALKFFINIVSPWISQRYMLLMLQIILFCYF